MYTRVRSVPQTIQVMAHKILPRSVFHISIFLLSTTALYLSVRATEADSTSEDETCRSENCTTWSSKACFTFKVDDVEQATASLSPSPTTDLEKVVADRRYERLIADMCGVPKLESFSEPMPGWTPIDRRGSNAFIEAINTAYDKHYPLVLSPDAVWLVIAQGFARHVNENAEKLRNLFVEHEGKKTLSVRRDDFIKGSLDNPWPEVFGEFSEKIRQNIGPKLHDLLSPTFTTTGPVEKAATDVVLMDTMKKYFEYV